MNNYINYQYLLIPERYILISKKINKNQKNINLHFATGGKILQQYINLTTLKCRENNIVCDKDIKCENTLKKLNCGNNRNFTNNLIIKCINLKSLDCGGNNNFTDEIFEYLPNLESLNCEKYYKNPISLFERTLFCPEMVELQPGIHPKYLRTLITNNGLKMCKKLKKLKCGKNSNISDFYELKNLEKLVLMDMINNSDYYVNQKIKINEENKIKYLDINYECDFNDELLMMCSNLEVLKCGINRKITDKSISTLTKLKKLVLAQSMKGITDEGLIKLQKLEVFKYDLNNNITEKLFDNLPNLTKLDMGNRNYENQLNLSKINFKNLKCLRCINLSKNKVDYSQFENFEELIFSDDENEISADDLKNLKKIKKLKINSKNINLSYNTTFNNKKIN